MASAPLSFVPPKRLSKTPIPKTCHECGVRPPSYGVSLTGGRFIVLCTLCMTELEDELEDEGKLPVSHRQTTRISSRNPTKDEGSTDVKNEETV